MPTEFLSGIVPRLPLSISNIILVDGAGGFTNGGTLNLFIQGRNRAGYTLVSNAIAPITYSATQAIEISFPVLARTPGTDYHYYIVSHSPTGNPTDAIALFHWRNYELDQITERPLNPVRLSRDEHILIADSVALPADLPTGLNLLPGMRRLVVGGVKTSAYYEYQELETRLPDEENLVLQPHGIERWVRTGSPNVGVINSIYGTDGCSTPVAAVEASSMINAPPYSADGTKGTPIKLIYRNDSTLRMPRGTSFLLQVQMEGAPASQLFDGKLMLTPRGFINLDNGSIDISDGLGGEMPGIGGDIPWTFGSRSTLFLHKDLPAGQAYFVEIAPYFSVAQLEGRILEGTNISINITPAAQSGENAYSVWQLTGNIVFASDDKLRAVPGVGLNARLGSGTALIERFTFPNRGERDIYGIAPNLAGQKITLDGNGSLFYRGTGTVPGTEQARAIISTMPGHSVTSVSASVSVGTNSGLALTLSYPCDADGYGLVRSDYPIIAGSTSGRFNPPYVRLFVKRQSDNTIYQLPTLVATSPDESQEVIITGLTGATIVDSLPQRASTDFCLFDPPSITTTVSSGTLEADTYTIFAAYYFDGSAISSISHSQRDGCLVEVKGTLNDLFAIREDLDSHTHNYNNPHQVKADQIGAFTSLRLKPSAAPITGLNEIAVFADIGDGNKLKVRLENNGAIELIGSGFTTEDDEMAAWIIKTTDYTAVAKDKIIGDTTNATFTLAMPASPLVGDEVKLLLVGINQLNLNFFGKPYQSTQPSTAYIAMENQEVSLVFVDEIRGWIPSRAGIIVTTVSGGGGSGG